MVCSFVGSVWSATAAPVGGEFRALILRLLRPGNSSLAAAAMLAACSPAPAAHPSPAPSIALAESAYADLRALRDRYDIATASGRTATTDGEPLATLAARHDALRIAVVSRLASLDSAGMGNEDARALRTMRAALAGDLGALGTSPADSATVELQPDCAYDAAAIAGAQRGLDSLRKRIYDCYGWAQHRIVVGTDTLDRLTILGKIGREADAHRRQALFLALAPVWQSMNGDNRPGSPYRALIALEVQRRGAGEPVAVSQARTSGSAGRLTGAVAAPNARSLAGRRLRIHCSNRGIGSTRRERRAVP